MGPSLHRVTNLWLSQLGRETVGWSMMRHEVVRRQVIRFRYAIKILVIAMNDCDQVLLHG